MTPSLLDLLKKASANRTELLTALEGENTNCYRLFHGTNEGASGLAIDRYGPQLLIQSFHSSLEGADIELIKRFYADQLDIESIVYNDRSASNSRRFDEQKQDNSQYVAQELGLNYRVKGKHDGQDPLLFLDMRAGRREVMAQAKGKSVLNLFSYTCGVGICAASVGARETVNIDFAERNLAVGNDNAQLNQLGEDKIEFTKSDFFTAIKQIAGIEIKQRLRRGEKPKRYPTLDQQQFDLVYLDPPRWAKSPFGTVDLIRDYQSVLKPSILATSPDGTLICTNNVAQVEISDWIELVKKCADKAGQPIRDYTIITPESDFPSPDGHHPLKMLALHF